MYLNLHLLFVFVPAGLVESARGIHPTASGSSALLRMASRGDC